MSEEEIIKFLEEYKKTGYNTLYIKNNGDRHKINSQIENAIQGLLDLYNKEKQKNKEYEERLMEKYKYVRLPEGEEYIFGEEAIINQNYISKDKIREKIEFYKRYGKVKNSEEYVMSVEIEVLQELLEEE